MRENLMRGTYLQENMARRMEAVQEAVQLLDRRLYLAETRLARLEAP
jgi:hypothetical protein